MSESDGIDSFSGREACSIQVHRKMLYDRPGQLQQRHLIGICGSSLVMGFDLIHEIARLMFFHGDDTDHNCVPCGVPNASSDDSCRYTNSFSSLLTAVRLTRGGKN
jgi:hypothetical protein